MNQIWEITDAKGNKRHVTLAEFRAKLDARAAMAKPIMDAFRRNDLAAVAATQKAMRSKFPC